MLSEFCCQNIILCLFKCRKINTCHLRHIDSFFLAKRTDNCFCNILFIKDSMYIGSTDILTVCAIFFHGP